LKIIISLLLAVVIKGIINLYTKRKFFPDCSKSYLINIFSLFLSIVFIISNLNKNNFISLSSYLVLAILLILIIISYVDYQTMIIPDTLLLVMILLFILGKIFNFIDFTQIFTLSSIVGLLVGFGTFYLIAFVSNGAMGGGDIKLVAVLGLWLGIIDIVIVMMLSFIIGSIISILLIIFKIKGMKDAIPFGPFIVIAFFCVYFYKDEILNIYLSLI